MSASLPNPDSVTCQSHSTSLFSAKMKRSMSQQLPFHDILHIRELCVFSSSFQHRTGSRGQKVILYYMIYHGLMTRHCPHTAVFRLRRVVLSNNKVKLFKNTSIHRIGWIPSQVSWKLLENARKCVRDVDFQILKYNLYIADLVELFQAYIQNINII